MKLPLMTVIKIGAIVDCHKCRYGMTVDVIATTDATLVLTKCSRCGYESCDRTAEATADFYLPHPPPRRIKIARNPMAEKRKHIQNRGFGVMMPSKNKEGTHPSAPGQYGYACCPCCEQQLKLSGWVKTTETGFKFVNLKFEQRTDIADTADQKQEGAPY